MQSYFIIFSFLVIISYNFNICIASNSSSPFYCFSKVLKVLISTKATNLHYSPQTICILSSSSNVSKEKFLPPKKSLLDIQLAINYNILKPLETLENVLLNIYSNENCDEIKILIQSQNQDQFLHILKMIGVLEQQRLQKSNSHLTCTPFFFIIGSNDVNNKITVEQLGKLVRNSSTDSSPTLTSNVYLIWPLASGNEWNKTSINCSIYEYYSVMNERESRAQFNSVKIENIGNFIKMRSNFQGVTLAATAMFDKKLNITSIMESKQTLNWQAFISTGMNEQIMGHFQKIFNFSLRLVPSYNFIEPPSPNGTWRGIAALLRNGSADMSIDQSSYVPFRAQYFTLLMPIFHVRINIYFRQPQLSAVRNLFIQPFSNYLWYALAGQFVLGLVLFTCLSYVIKKFSNRGKNSLFLALTEETLLSSRKDKEFFKSGYYIVWLTSFLTGQGWYTTPKKTCLRIIFLIGSVGGLITYTAYSANLISLFASDKKPINNLHEFVQSQVPLFIADGSATLGTFFGGSLYGKSFKFIDRDQGMINTMNNLTNTPSAFMTYADRFYIVTRSLVPYATDGYFCNHITEISATSAPVQAGMILPKNSTLKEFFNYGIIQMGQTGLLAREQKNYKYTFKPICDIYSRRKKTFHELTLNDTMTAFIIVMVGILVSIFVLVVENGNNNSYDFIMNKFKNLREARND